MGCLQDLLKEVPLSSVLRERVALAEEKFERVNKELETCKQRVAGLEREIETLRAQLPVKQPKALNDDTTRVDEVAEAQGDFRASVYGEVWSSLYELQGNRAAASQ
jgi:hypothetical protein